MCAPAYKPSPVGEGGCFGTKQPDEVSIVEVRFTLHPKGRNLPLRGRGGLVPSHFAQANVLRTYVWSSRLLRLGLHFTLERNHLKRRSFLARASLTSLASYFKVTFVLHA